MAVPPVYSEFALGMKGTMTDDMFEAASPSNSSLAKLAAERRNDADLEAMCSALDAMRAAGNSVMATMMEMLSHLLLESRSKPCSC
jgi:DNA-binding FadR family transcriptional regulator